MGNISADVVEVVRCKDCVHQTKVWHKDARLKYGGYFIYGCDYYDGYSKTCLDNDYCSYGEKALEPVIQERSTLTNARKFREVFGNLGYPDLVRATPGTTIFPSAWWNEPYEKPEE